jgi:peroxiredoxin
MKFLLSLSLVVILGIAGSCQSTPGGFTLSGKVTGFPDSTRFYLDLQVGTIATTLDSAWVIDGQLRLKGALPSPVAQVILHTRNFSDYIFFWLENAAITLTAEKGKFKQAVITGSVTQDEEQQLNLAIKSRGEEKPADIAFIRAHPNSLVSANILNIYASTWGKDTAALLYETLSDKMKKTTYGKNILEFIQLNRKIQIGETYVDFTQPDTAGRNVKVSDYKGKVLLLDFWGSWCGPCRANNPELVKIYHEFKDKGFEILGVAADDQRKYWTEAIRHDSLTWTNVCDLRGNRNKAALIYGIYKYPSSFLINADGIIVAEDLRGDQLRTKLKELLK